MVDRRGFLRSSAVAAAALSFAGCAGSRSARTTLPSPEAPSATARNSGRLRHPTVHLPLVDASWDRVIRTTVGLRPHRDAGFVLRAEKLDAKMLIHNYGHGGAGMSISWGTGLMAAEFALQQPERRAAVIGCGAVGLTAARQLQRRGFDVTIYAMAVPPDTTSNMSLAGFTPTSGLIEPNMRTPEWDAQFRRAAEIAYTQLQLITRPEYGISWIYSYSPTDETGESRGEGGLLPPHLRNGFVVLEPGEHPFPTKYAVQSPSLRIEPSIYLDALVRDFLRFGGHIVIRKFDTPRDLMSLSESVVVNCTGLGSRALFSDRDLVPLKGQLTHFIPQPEVDYQLVGSGRGVRIPGGLGVHTMPRQDGIALGGTSERDVWSLDPNEELRKIIVDEHIRLFTSMRPPAPSRLTSNFKHSRPSTPALESFFELSS